MTEQSSIIEVRKNLVPSSENPLSYRLSSPQYYYGKKNDSYVSPTYKSNIFHPDPLVKERIHTTN